MSLTIMWVRNGYLLRDGEVEAIAQHEPVAGPRFALCEEPDGTVIVRAGDDVEVILDDPADETAAARELLYAVLERFGPSSSRYAAERIRVITLPGDKWVPREGEACTHPWVEMWEYEGQRGWSCPCGAAFAPTSEGRAPGSF